MNRNKLTAAFVRTVAKPGRYQDGMGLFLDVRATGSKAWTQRLTIHGRRRDLGLGSTARVSLADARRKAFRNWCIARDGSDPVEAARAARVPTFAEALDRVIEIHREGWKDPDAAERHWRSPLNAYALPRIGRKPVDSVTPADVMAVLLPLWQTKHETARKVRSRIGAVMKWAIAEGHRQDDPAGDAIRAALPKNGKPKQHHRALPYNAVAGALATVQASGAWPVTKLALEFMILTATRSGEARLARWTEIDLDAAVWTVPAERMKAKRDHRVPLSARALAILRAVRPYGDGEGLIFPSPYGRAFSKNAFSKLLRDLGIEAVPHGFRSSFRDWTAERTNAPREVAELALAHVEGSAVERAYRRTDLFERRRKLMQSWADYLASEPGGKVIPLSV